MTTQGKEKRVDSRGVIEAPQIRLFVNANPLAVFSVLADLENRDRILTAVSEVRNVSPLPVETGTVVRESTGAILALRSRQLRIVEFAPPQLIGFERTILGRKLRADIRLHRKPDGTRVVLDIRMSAFRLLPQASTWLVNRWARQLERDIIDIRRHVEPRANPSWRGGLSRSDAR